MFVFLLLPQGWDWERRLCGCVVSFDVLHYLPSSVQPGSGVQDWQNQGNDNKWCSDTLHTQMKSESESTTCRSCLPLLVITWRRQIQPDKCTSCHEPNWAHPQLLRQHSWNRNDKSSWDVEESKTRASVSCKRHMPNTVVKKCSDPLLK